MQWLLGNSLKYTQYNYIIITNYKNYFFENGRNLNKYKKITYLIKGKNIFKIKKMIL